MVKKFGDDRASSLAALVAYYAFFSLFPLLLAFVSILGFVLEGDPSLRDKVLARPGPDEIAAVSQRYVDAQI